MMAENIADIVRNLFGNEDSSEDEAAIDLPYIGLQIMRQLDEGIGEHGAGVARPSTCCSTTSPDPVALALSGTVVTLLLLCLCCLCKFRGKPAPLPAGDMSQPTMVVTQRTYFHSLSTDQPPPYTPPPEFPGNVALWPPVTLQKVPDTPPPPYSVTITHSACVVPLSA